MPQVYCYQYNLRLVILSGYFHGTSTPPLSRSKLNHLILIVAMAALRRRANIIMKYNNVYEPRCSHVVYGVRSTRISVIEMMSMKLLTSGSDSK